MTFSTDPGNNDPGDTPDRPVTLTGRTVLDSRLMRAGTVTDVLFDSRPPGWAVVKTGRLSGEHFVPLEDTYVDVAGRLVVPIDKAEIKHAPRAGRDHVITWDTRRKLRDYYGVAA